MVLSVQAGLWDTLRAMDMKHSVLLDLIDPGHLDLTPTPASARLLRIDAACQMLKNGCRTHDARGTWIQSLASWPFPDLGPDPVSGNELAAWVEMFKAAAGAGHALSTPPEADFDEWAQKQAWAGLVTHRHLASVAQALARAGLVSPYVPAQPQWPAWPACPTSELLDAMRCDTAWIWQRALSDGFPLAGPSGQAWLRTAPLWDTEGEVVRQALKTGQIDVHARHGGRRPLEYWFDTHLAHGIGTAALVALVEHDPSVLDDTDAFGRPAYGQVMDYLAQARATGLSDPAERHHLDRLRTIALAHRAAHRLEEALPPAAASQSVRF